MQSFKCEIVSASKIVFEGDIVQLTAKTKEGEIGILKDHSPLLAALEKGDIRLKFSDGSLKEFKASNGFLSVEEGCVRAVASEIYE